MPDRATSLEAFHELAVSELEQSLFSQLESRLLLAHEIDCYKERLFSRGWRFQIEFSDRPRFIDFLISKDFPFVEPSIALVDCPQFLTWPHIEEDGVLCLLPSSVDISYCAPVTVARSLIIDAKSLIQDCIAGNNQDDFRHEFFSYWTRTIESNAVDFISLIEPSPPSRVIKIWKGKQFYLLGEDEVSIRNWFFNRFGEKDIKIDSAGLIWIAHPLHPKEYPKKNSDIWKLAQECTNYGDNILPKLVDDPSNEVALMIGAPSDNGPCLAGITAFPPYSSSIFGNTQNIIQQGFRPSKLPPSLLANRYWHSSTSIRRSNVVRADHSWIHGRGKDTRQTVLASSSIAIIGCGSIGASVANMLAMAGVGKTLLIDPEILVWANISRHMLGARYIDKFKAESLAKELRENYPHQIFESRNEKWQIANRNEPELLTSKSLIISATGSWSAESALNVWHHTHNRSFPILYGWTEAHACAGQAVAITSNGGCLQCGFSNDGLQNLQVTKWQDGEKLLQEPACGAVYQPFGPVELSHTISLISELALDILLGKISESTHSIWSCRKSSLEALRGEWTDKWLHITSGRDEGGFLLSQSWEYNSTCEVCSFKE